MGFIRGVCRLVFAVIIIAVGVLLYTYSFDEMLIRGHDYYQQIIAQAPAIPNEILTYRQIIALLIGVYGLIKLWMGLTPKKRVRSVTFMGTHGEVTIELEPVETTLQQVALKLPEVKNITIKLNPLEGNGRIQIEAVAILQKSADEDARMITARIHHFLQLHTTRIVGLKDVEAKLTVKRWLMKMKTVKVEPLLLESKEEPAHPKKSEKSVHILETPQVITPPTTSGSLSLDTEQEHKFNKY